MYASLIFSVAETKLLDVTNCLITAGPLTCPTFLFMVLLSYYLNNIYKILYYDPVAVLQHNAVLCRQCKIFSKYRLLLNFLCAEPNHTVQLNKIQTAKKCIRGDSLINCNQFTNFHLWPCIFLSRLTSILP
jgi:hypothetical protein